MVAKLQDFLQRSQDMSLPVLAAVAAAANIAANAASRRPCAFAQHGLQLCIFLQLDQSNSSSHSRRSNSSNSSSSSDGNGSSPCISDLGCSRQNLGSFYHIARGDASR